MSSLSSQTPGSSPRLMPHSPPSRAPGSFTRTSLKRVPSLTTIMDLGSTVPPSRVLRSTSTISLLSLSFASANMDDESSSISSVLEESPYARLSPSASFTSANKYLNSAQHKRVSHYMSAGSPTSRTVSQRGSAVNLLQLASTGSRSRRASFQGQQQMMLIPPDSPALGPVSLCSSPSHIFLSQTPPISSRSDTWANGNADNNNNNNSNNSNYMYPSKIINGIQEADPVESLRVRNTAAELAAALESEIMKSTSSTQQGRQIVSSTPISIPMRYFDVGAGIDSPELRPAETPLETAPMTPMVLDNSLPGGIFGGMSTSVAHGAS